MRMGDLVLSVLIAMIILAFAFFATTNAAYEQGREDGGVHMLDVLEQEGYCDKGIKQ